MKKNIIFFARDYQTKFFLALDSDKYNSMFVVLTKKEKECISRQGRRVIACFEESFFDAPDKLLDDCYLKTSFVSDRFLGGLRNNERRDVLAREIFFWKNVFDRYKPDAVINEMIAIEISEVMHIEAKKRNIPYWSWMSSFFKDREFFWLESPFNTSLNKEIFSRNPSAFAMEKAKLYIEDFKKNKSNEIFYVKNLKKRYSQVGFIKNLIHFFVAFFKSIILFRKHYYFRSYYSDFAFIKNRLVNYLNSLFYRYDDLDDVSDFEIVFYPLHFEPEASILYMSEWYENQTSLIRNIAKCLKNNQVLVVKEHPQQLGFLLNRKYRELRRGLSNVYYLPGEFPSFDIIEKSKLVITQTGTAGWEALLLNKPVFIFGNVFYDNYLNLNKVESFFDLKESIRSGNYKRPDPQLTLKYVAQFWEYCVPGNPFIHANLYSSDNISNIVNAINQKIEKELDIGR